MALCRSGAIYTSVARRGIGVAHSKAVLRHARNDGPVGVFLNEPPA